MATQNRVFFPQEALDQWIASGAVDLAGSELTMLAEGRRYEIAEAVHVIREVTGGEDANALIGRVKERAVLASSGAEILEGSMILGDNAYDVVAGWIGKPIGTFTEFASSPARVEARKSRPDVTEREPGTDEDLLATFLLRTMK